MRSGVKLKHVLANHSIDLSLGEDGRLELITIDKHNGDATLYVASSFSAVVDKAYRGILKQTKTRVRSGATR